MKRFVLMKFCVLLAFSVCSTAAAAIERPQNQSRHVYAPDESIEADVHDEHAHDELTEAGFFGTGHETYVRKTRSIANGAARTARVSQEDNASGAFTNKVATVRSLQEGGENCTFIVSIGEAGEKSVCDLVIDEKLGGDVSGETITSKQTCKRGNPACGGRRSLAGPGEFNYPTAVGYMVVTATGINNCTSFEEQLNGTFGVLYVERDVLGYLVNENMKEQVSEVTV
jgi:hypothetical protein